MGSGPRVWFALVALAFMSVAGCSVYVPRLPQEIAPGSRVRVTVDPAALSRVQEFTRTAEDGTLDGSFVDLTRDSVVLSLWRTDLVSAGSSFRAGTVRVPLDRAHVVQLSERRISPVRTGLFAAALVGGAYVIVRSVFGGTGGDASGGSGGGPSIVLIPLSFPR